MENSGDLLMNWVSYEEVVRRQVDEHDVDNLRQFYHEDFIYLREAEMLSFEDVRQHIIDDFVSGKFISTNRKTLHEDEFSSTFEHDVTAIEPHRGIEAGDTYRVRIIIQKKDGLFWRQNIHPIKKISPSERERGKRKIARVNMVDFPSEEDMAIRSADYEAKAQSIFTDAEILMTVKVSATSALSISIYPNEASAEASLALRDQHFKEHKYKQTGWHLEGELGMFFLKETSDLRS